MIYNFEEKLALEGSLKVRKGDHFEQKGCNFDQLSAQLKKQLKKAGVEALNNPFLRYQGSGTFFDSKMYYHSWSFEAEHKDRFFRYELYEQFDKNTGEESYFIRDTRTLNGLHKELRWNNFYDYGFSYKKIDYNKAKDKGSELTYVTHGRDSYQYKDQFAVDKWNYFYRPLPGIISKRFENIKKSAKEDTKRKYRQLKTFQILISLGIAFAWLVSILAIIIYLSMNYPSYHEALQAAKGTEWLVITLGNYKVFGPAIGILGLFILIYKGLVKGRRKTHNSAKKYQQTVELEEQELLGQIPKTIYHEDDIDEFREEELKALYEKVKEQKNFRSDLIKPNKTLNTRFADCIDIVELGLIQSDINANNQFSAADIYAMRVNSKGLIQSRLMFVMFIFLTENQIAVYSCIYDFVLNKTYNEKNSDFYYEDVIRFSDKNTQIKNPFDQEKTKDFSILNFNISLRDGSSFSAALPLENTYSSLNEMLERSQAYFDKVGSEENQDVKGKKLKALINEQIGDNEVAKNRISFIRGVWNEKKEQRNSMSQTRQYIPDSSGTLNGPAHQTGLTEEEVKNKIWDALDNPE